MPASPVPSPIYPSLPPLHHQALQLNCQLKLLSRDLLFGRGFGRLWNGSLLQRNVHFLIHRGLTGSVAFYNALDHDGAMSMAGQYAAVLAATFNQFDLIGASFGAILASHVLHGTILSRSGSGHRPRLVLVDPPPAISKELPVPKMLSSLRTAAMGVLLIHLR